ncbi:MULTISPECIES: hypothetical protein [unclassified Beijerinckia]|uniref:hypothetical protein n=1 Tax=unclassified Beijerinckia TaxID=2638183 RepID=UPI000B8A52BF|nr:MULTISPECIES: hypothetical protein [unclassified Beijerinckia]MDH7794107.1 phage terminase large subunit [Beijerinckia sp. GAS462]
MGAVRAERVRRAAEKQNDHWQTEIATCGADILHWFDHWVWTYDPRLVGKAGGAFVPLRLWPKQREIVLWMLARIQAGEEGLLEKSRDVGATYLCAGVALHQWLFMPGFKATFGSRKVDYVDRRDNPDSIFAKLRLMLRRLPRAMLPEGFNFARHDTSMRLVNPANGGVISGEGGEDMGRGGRSSVYFLDEAAFVPHADTVERALSGNSDCVIWASSVNGMGNLFARKRHSILKAHQIARLHWRDDPRKSESWALAKRASFADPAAWASEYDIDYAASLEGACIPAVWVESAKRLGLLEPGLVAESAIVGLDVGAGKAKSVAVTRRGAFVDPPISRDDPDTTDTALWALDIARCADARVLSFDAPGVGAGVASTLMKQDVSGRLAIAPINTGASPSRRRWPDGRLSSEMFGNLKAEIWWLCRTALQRTHEHVQFLQGNKGRAHARADLLALPSGDAESDALCLQLSLVKWERNDKGRIVIEGKPALRQRGIASPDHADALMLTFVEPDLYGMLEVV